MDLTPEERQRIYEEEKARLEAQEQIRKEMAAKQAAAARTEQQRSQSDSNRRTLVGVAVLVGLGLLYGVAEQWSEWFPSAEDTARQASSAELLRITESLDSSKETLKERAALYSTVDMIEDMQALFEARWRELQELKAKNGTIVSLDKSDKDSLNLQLDLERAYVSDILKSQAEIYYQHRTGGWPGDRIKGKSVQSVTALGKEIKLGDAEADVTEVFPYEGHYEVYGGLDSGRGSDSAPEYLLEHLYITSDLALEVTFSAQSRVVRLFVRDGLPASERSPQIELGEGVASITIRGKRLSVGDTPDVASFGLEKKDWIMRPTVESDPKDAKGLRVTLYYAVGGKRFAVVLHSGSEATAYRPTVESIASPK